MELKDEEVTKFVQIYLFGPQGKFYWCNGSNDVDIENQGVLHAGLFATLYQFSIETLGEKLNYLLLNELRINMFPLYDKYLVAVVTPKFLKFDHRQIQIIKTKIHQVIEKNKSVHEDNIIDLITTNLNILLGDLMDWLDRYVSQASRAMHVLTNEIKNIDENELGVFLYTWDSNRVFKYIPSSSVIDYQIEELIDKSLTNVEFLSNLNRTYLIQDNTILYFIVTDVILILTKSSDKDSIAEDLEKIQQSSDYFEEIITSLSSEDKSVNQ